LGSLAAEAAMVIYSAQPIKMGGLIIACAAGVEMAQIRLSQTQAATTKGVSDCVL
jgi:hypothetical protein